MLIGITIHSEKQKTLLESDFPASESDGMPRFLSPSHHAGAHTGLWPTVVHLEWQDMKDCSLDLHGPKGSIR
jgi:hypothetical protein